MQRDVNELFGRSGREDARARALVPAMDAWEAEDGTVLQLELPGLAPEQVDIEVVKGVLTISGERPKQEVGEGRWLCRERSTGSFSRTVALPEGAKPDAVSASFDHGVLEVRVPHAAEQRAHRVEIATGGDRGAVEVGA